MTIHRIVSGLLLFLIILFGCQKTTVNKGLTLSENGYFEMQGLNVLVFNNSYSEGHQGGVEIIQHGNRVATGGNLRLSPSPGQWQPVPMLGEGFQKVGCSPQKIGLMSRIVDSVNNEIHLNCSYPDTGRKEKGFNPLIYPDIAIKYTVKVKASGNSFTITVDLEEPLSEEWVGKVGYNLEFFPGDLYGKTFAMDDIKGIFPRQANGPVYMNSNDEAEVVPLAEGNKLVIAPEVDLQRITIESTNSKLQLLDGSFKHNNGWFVVRSLIPGNTTKGAVTWTITPNVIPHWVTIPVIHNSQIGYHPDQKKVAFIELDKNDLNVKTVSLLKLGTNGEKVVVQKDMPHDWGMYLRYHYYTYDFSDVKEKGIYFIQYGNSLISNPFPIDPTVYNRHVWQPALEYFLPVQMCHMRINQKYRVWHGACHLDDALMAPVNVAHFDGYNNTDDSLPGTKYKPLQHVPGLNIGGWHDAGDYDIRVESQSAAVIALSLASEEFELDYDATFIDQENRHVEIHQPDGKADLLQQVEHGVLSILSGYRQFGRLYRGIIVPSLRQYVHLGDGATQTDNKVFTNESQKAKAARIDGLWYKKVANRYSNIFDPELFLDWVEVYAPELDDRLVFMNTRPYQIFLGAAALATASRVLKYYDPKLSEECITAAIDIYETNKNNEGRWSKVSKIQALGELLRTTGNHTYKEELKTMEPDLEKSFFRAGAAIARVIPYMDDPEFSDIAKKAALSYKPKLDSITASTPFGIPLEGAEYIGFTQYYLHKTWPDIFTIETMYNALNYIFGCRPGNTTNSLISGVGVESPTVAYGANRADWSYIPGGTFWNAVNLVSPDLAEDKIWPFLWQEREYIITAPCYHLFSTLAAEKLLSK